MFGGYTTSADYQIPSDDRVINSRFDEQSLKTSMGYNTKKWVSNLRYSFLKNSFGITEDADYSKSTDRQPLLPYQDINHQMLSMENTWFIDDSELDLTLGFSQNDRQEFEEQLDESTLNMRLRSYTYNVKWHSAPISDHFGLIIGYQCMHQINENFGEEMLIPDATTNDIGLFAMANYDWKKLKLQFGLRGDHRQIDTKEYVGDDSSFEAFDNAYQNLNYAVGGVYTMDNLVFRINLASGFRAPNTSELLSDGVHEGTQRYELGNVNLKSEQATQIDLSMDFNSEHVNFSISPFINFIDHFIYLSPTDSVKDGVPVYAYQQTGAQLFGGEAGVHIHPHSLHWLHIEGTASMVYAQDRQGNSLPLIPASNINSRIQTNLSQSGNVMIKEVFVEYNYTFDQQRIGEFETVPPEYGLLNMGCAFEIATKGRPIEISAGINNMLNTEYISHLSRFKSLQIPYQGMNIYLGLAVGLEGKL